MGIEEVTGRIAANLEHLKQYTATPGEGCTRLPFTKEAREAAEYLKGLMEERSRKRNRNYERGRSFSSVRYDGLSL